MDDSILIGIGGNLPSPALGPPQSVLQAAVAALADAGVSPLRRSAWYRSCPEPPSDQPPFVNGVLQVASPLPPDELLALLHTVEAGFGRVRAERNAARVLDLDLLAYGRRVTVPGAPGAILPHPRLHQRAFVLVPLVELAPDWRHPVSGLPAAMLLAMLPGDHGVVPTEAETFP